MQFLGDVVIIGLCDEIQGVLQLYIHNDAGHPIQNFHFHLTKELGKGGVKHYKTQHYDPT